MVAPCQRMSFVVMTPQIDIAPPSQQPTCGSHARGRWKASRKTRRVGEVAPNRARARHCSRCLCLTFLLDKRPADALAAAERSPSEFWQLHGKALALHDL